MNDTALFRQILQLAKSLPAREKVRLIEQLAPDIEKELAENQVSVRRSLRGLWRGVETTEEEIDSIREELWKSFPRDLP